MEALEERIVHLNLSTLKALPVSIRSGSSNGKIDPICRDIVLERVIKDSLEWRENLLRSVKHGKAERVLYNDAANVKDYGLRCIP